MSASIIGSNPQGHLEGTGSSAHQHTKDHIELSVSVFTSSDAAPQVPLSAVFGGPCSFGYESTRWPVTSGPVN